MALKIRPARPGSFASVYIQLLATTVDGEDKKVGTGTGFFYRQGGNIFLITNWHVVAGRNPDQPQYLLYQPPTRLSFSISKKNAPDDFSLDTMIELYDGSTPRWLQLISADERIDLVAFQVTLPDEAHLVAVNDFSDEPSVAYEPGRDVAVVGFPFEPGEGNPFPVWKKAMIATEPAYAVLGKRQCLLDTPGRPGMSGSPVYFMAKGARLRQPLVEKMNGASALDFIASFTPQDMLDLSDETYVLEFAGIYLGSYGDQSLDHLNLGRMLTGDLVTQLIEKGVAGENPFPPS